ncbi:hypothetical protein NYR70_00185 [Actinobacillus equuli subsp. equuli]|uniref:DUF3761 domain-containing protein n=1 Tax=Actinobacillus equuli TaxID=718 RepID=A0AAX3FJR9_ACTEU|nr:hypothetical protein [Actinobacillus equuli]AIZ78227.1 hypothetical protein ACEE_00180 [Actinobacillus equuli subsp. equuli]MDG4951646.1 hypothetical protein [Actinobacillus equuli subsp. equuli]WGE44502.1 hypothetical protein NYR65_00180 [Actinobacillus equuli subsp. equuli]WGE46661.1 hypothetical protein NYR84_00180 [Actinobacillus equuli subsp. haemolyticus]WGE48769.1 hypothetical protein NYR67_00180 [Actinobacillus equuli subsp. equuli]
MKAHLFSLVALAVTITACSSDQPVQIVKEPSTKTEYIPIRNPHPIQQVLPANVTAICVDGSYSTSPVHEACVGNGGAKQIISRYHSE